LDFWFENIPSGNPGADSIFADSILAEDFFGARAFQLSGSHFFF
jgi:hypothetical protein